MGITSQPTEPENVTVLQTQENNRVLDVFHFPLVVVL